MSSLDDLKSGVRNTPIQDEVDIDMTKDIDGVNNKPKQRINISGGNATVGRQKVSISDMVDSLGMIANDDNEPSLAEEENLIKDPNSYAKSILYGEDSLLENWKKDKIEEYNERMAQFDEEREELIEEGKLDPKDIKDDDYEGNVDRDEDDEEEDDSTTLNEDADLVLEDDLLVDIDEEDEIEATSTQEEVDTIPEDKETADEMIAKKKQEEKEVKTVHITEEDKELFDTVGAEIDSSRFIEDDEDEEESTDKKKKDKDSTNEVIDEDEEPDDVDEDNDETLRHLKELITEKLQPTFKKIDINQFKIVSKKSTSNIKPITDGRQLRVVKWVLPNQKQCVFMKQFTGLELQTLSENIQDGSNTSMNIAYRSIYDHIVSNKPKKFTDWLAITPDSDIDHYMFCVFLASYKGSNYLPMSCPNDNCPDPTFLTDDINVMDMVKFKDDEAKNKFTKIYKSEVVYSNVAGYYVTATTPVSNKLAISFKESTLKDVIDMDTLDERFRTQYRTVIALIPYIDTMYQMDIESQTLTEIKCNEYDSNIKTLRTKIRKYAKVIDTLTSDEFGVITAIIQDISAREDMMSYVIPEIECPACGRKIDEVATSATQLVFTRYQLGALLNTQLN